jgi:hypothetical protein
MKYLLRTLAILALITMVVQTTRHAYMLWLQPQGSVLDRFDQPVRDQIAQAKSLEDLVRQYEAALKTEGPVPADNRDSIVEGMPPGVVADMARHSKRPSLLIKAAIQDWEEKHKEIHQLRFYSLVGGMLVLLGAALYLRFNRWLGLTLVVTGFSEIVYWTSPTFFGASTEWVALLTNKFWLTVGGLALLLAGIWLLDVFGESSGRFADSRLDPPASTARREP